ncbi:hypothetical protein [Nonomuraea dietziae]|uniref:hypothetical protein n=1 Tax=Nonomuraea dietziae TaxID=65515 RepID=UPI0033F8153E
MSVTRLTKLGIALLLVILLVIGTLMLAAHLNRSSWWHIRNVSASPSGTVLIAKLTFGTPKVDGRFCEQVTDTVVEESPSRVIVGIHVTNTCAPFLPWENVNSADIAYPFHVSLHLQSPLGERLVVDKESGRHISIMEP